MVWQFIDGIAKDTQAITTIVPRDQEHAFEAVAPRLPKTHGAPVAKWDALWHTVTYGGDFSNDTANVGNGNEPGNAKRTAVSLQWQVNYSNWFEMINAARYDAFDLDGGACSIQAIASRPTRTATTAEKLARRSRRCSLQ
jgi:hypothetical protein